MSTNSILVSDMIGKLLSIQQTLTTSPSSSEHAQLSQNFNDLHLRVDNLYRSITRAVQLTPTTTNGVISQELIIFSPTLQFHEAFTRARFVKTTGLNALPWLKNDENSAALKNKEEQRVRKRIVNGNGQGGVKKSARRNVLGNKSDDRSASRSGPGSIMAESMHKKKFRELARLPEQGNSEVVENAGNVDGQLSAASTLSFSSLVYRPKAAGSFPPAISPAPSMVQSEEMKED